MKCQSEKGCDGQVDMTRYCRIPMAVPMPKGMCFAVESATILEQAFLCQKCGRAHDSNGDPLGEKIFVKEGKLFCGDDDVGGRLYQGPLHL